MGRKTKDETEEVGISPEEQLKTYIKNNSSDIFYDDDIEYSVSSGSLTFDIETNGGIRPGVTRMSGISEGGKTSCSFGYMFNFLNTPGRKRRGVYFRAEKKESKEMSERTGIKFVHTHEEWKDGTCFVFKSNVYEAVVSLIRTLVHDNPTKTEFFFVVDSLDSLVPRDDLAKGFEEANKVAGGALLTSDFLRKMAVSLSNRGHVCILISQVRSTVTINPYAKTDPKLTNASGGNAAIHYSDWIFEFQQRWNDDIIWEGEKNKSKRLGHYCKVIFRKSPNEKTGREVKYPICYYRKSGKSIWVEYEIFDLLLAFDYLKKGGAWLNFSSSAFKELKDCGFDTVPEKIQGKDQFITFLEDNPKIAQFYFNKFKGTLSAIKQNDETLGMDKTEDAI